MNQKIAWLIVLLASTSIAHSQTIGIPFPNADTALIQASNQLLEQAATPSIYLGGSWNPHLPGYHEAQFAWRQPLNSRTNLEASLGNIAFAGTREYQVGLRFQRRFGKVIGALAWNYAKEDLKAAYTDHSYQGIRAILGFTPGSRWKYFMDWQTKLAEGNSSNSNLSLILFHQAGDHLSLNGIAHFSSGKPLIAMQAVYALRRSFLMSVSLSSQSSLGFTMQYQAHAFRFQMRFQYQRAFGFLPQHAMTYGY